MKKQGIVFVFFAFIICSCDSMNGRYFNFDQQKFDRERSKWENNNIKNYIYIQELSSDAYPNGKVRITVSEDKEPIIENLDKWALENFAEEYKQNQAFYLSPTISSIYSSLEKEVTNARKYYEEGKCKAIDFKIVYNQKYHYPETVNYVVWYTEKDGMLGGPGYTLKITEFTPTE